MPHVDYLSRNLINESKDSDEETFIRNVGYYKSKFGMIFIYNYYGLFMSVRTVPTYMTYINLHVERLNHKIKID